MVSTKNTTCLYTSKLNQITENITEGTKKDEFVV